MRRPLPSMGAKDSFKSTVLCCRPIGGFYFHQVSRELSPAFSGVSQRRKIVDLRFELRDFRHQPTEIRRIAEDHILHGCIILLDQGHGIFRGHEPQCSGCAQIVPAGIRPPERRLEIDHAPEELRVAQCLLLNIRMRQLVEVIVVA